MKILSYLYSVRTQDTLFDAVELQQRYCENPFGLGDAYLIPFFTFAVAFCTTHGQNNTRKYDTGGFLPVASLNSVVRSSFSFIASLIGITVRI